MTTDQVIGQFAQHVIGNYGRQPHVIVKGDGAYIWDLDGHRVLDMFPGWAVSSIGHCHPKVVQAIREQAGTLIHIDNTFYSLPQGELAQLLSERSFGGKCFFCNSGAEAIEASLKLARKHTSKQKYKFITFQGSFHGRTYGAITATAQPKYHEGFGPMLPGFVYLPWGDLESLQRAVDEEVAAILIEPVQGEGGIRPAGAQFLQAARDLSQEAGALLIFDEVQTGCGRTGKWFAYQHFGIEPDIMTLAKTLGGGASIAAMIAQPDVAESLTPGTHAATFGGNPLACAAAIAAIRAIEEEGMVENAARMGEYLLGRLAEMRQRFGVIEDVRGLGLMVGIELSEPGKELVNLCYNKGLRINCTQETVLRLMPPLNVTQDLLDQALDILSQALTESFEQSS